MARRKGARGSQEPRPVRLSHWRYDGQAKVRYRSEEEANKASLGYRLHEGADLLPYKCEFCGGWHLGTI